MSKLSFWLKVMLYYLTSLVLTGIFVMLQMKIHLSEQYIQLPQAGPAVTAIIFLLFEGKDIKSFFKKGFKFRLDKFTLLMLLTTIIFTAIISVLSTSFWKIDNINWASMSLTSNYFIFSTILAAACEEIGWRGYMLTKLQSKMTPEKASIVLGILWGLWHVPKLFIGIKYFAAWFVGIIGLTFILTYTFNRSGGNIWSATLVHSAVNLLAYFFLFGAASDVRVILMNSCAYILCAAVLIVSGRRYISSKEYTTR